MKFHVGTSLHHVIFTDRCFQDRISQEEWCRKVRQNDLCLCVQQSVNFLSIYRTEMAIFLGVCIELIPHVSEHDPMEVSFSAAIQGDQISQVDFSRNLSVYFYALLYLNAEV